VSCALAALVTLASAPAASQTATKKSNYKVPRTAWTCTTRTSAGCTR
jgi:hypothetical protein